MKVLLDTHALIWFALGDDRLPTNARDTIDLLTNDVLVSAASAWEIATKYRIGKLPEATRFVESWSATVGNLRFSELPITAEHALRAGLLTIKNRDPFDRMIAAQALLEEAVAVSNETGWDAAGVVRVWA